MTIAVDFDGTIVEPLSPDRRRNSLCHRYVEDADKRASPADFMVGT